MMPYFRLITLASALLILSLSSSFAFSEEITLINAGTVEVTDLPTSSAKSITLDIQDARFANRSVDHLKLQANGIDFKQGVLQSLKADMQNGYFDNNIKLDEFIITTQAFAFDTLELLTHQRFILTQPISAQVQLNISENNLQNFFAHPKTIKKLEKAIRKKTGGFSLIHFSNPTLQLLGNEKVKLNLLVILGQALAAPVEIEGDMKIKRQRLQFQDLQITSSDVALPIDIASAIQKELNKLIDLQKIGAKNNFIIHAQSVKSTKKMLSIIGQTSLSRLEFGAKQTASRK